MITYIAFDYTPKQFETEELPEYPQIIKGFNPVDAIERDCIKAGSDLIFVEPLEHLSNNIYGWHKVTKRLAGDWELTTSYVFVINPFDSLFKQNF